MDKLKEESNKKNDIKLFQTDIDSEKKESNDEKEKDIYIKQKEEELEQIKSKIAQYENGTIIPEEVKKKKSKKKWKK